MPAPIGKCRLCLTNNVELRDSHIIPAWAYKDLRDDRSGEPPEAIVIDENGTARRVTKQLREYMLCDLCERKFGDYDKYVGTLAYDAGKLPALAAVGPMLTPDGSLVQAELGSLEAGRLAYFAASVVWRGHAAKSVPRCNLGPYADSFREHLNGERKFPGATCVDTCLLRDNEAGWQGMSRTCFRRRIPDHQAANENAAHTLFCFADCTSWSAPMS